MGLCQENIICLESDSGKKRRGGGRGGLLEISEEGGICPGYNVSVFTQEARVSKFGSLKNSVKCFSIAQEP